MARKLKEVPLKQTFIRVSLTEGEFTPAAIIRKVCKALRDGGCSMDFIRSYRAEAMRVKGSLGHVLATTRDVVRF